MTNEAVARALAAPHDHPGWSRLRAELLATYAGLPLPVEAVHVVRFRGSTQAGGVLARLRKGPLRSDEWHGIANNTATLRVQISILRCNGVPIRSERTGATVVWHLED